MNKVIAQRLEMVREKAVEPAFFGNMFSEWAGNDDDDKMLKSALRLFQIDTDDVKALQEAHASFLQAVMDASGIDTDDAMDALEALREGYRQSAWEAMA